MKRDSFAQKKLPLEEEVIIGKADLFKTKRSFDLL
jgi:hypothetical protein